MIYCCNCMNCKIVKGSNGYRGYKARCAAGRWGKTKKGDKLSLVRTIFLKKFESCQYYDSLNSNAEKYAVELRKEYHARSRN